MTYSTSNFMVRLYELRKFLMSLFIKHKSVIYYASPEMYEGMVDELDKEVLDEIMDLKTPHSEDS